jgi:hypothetical protein
MDRNPPTQADPQAASDLVFNTRPLGGQGTAQPSAVTLAAPAEPPPPPAAPTLKLVVVRGERPDAGFRLLDGKNYVGRTADFAVDIDLDGQEAPERTWASRRHAVISVEGPKVAVEDLHSLNGTFVNRTRLHPGQKKLLAPGDVVQIGTVQLKLVAGPSAG